MQAKRRRLRKAAEVRSTAMVAAGEALGPQVSVTTKGPAGRSVEEDTGQARGGRLHGARKQGGRET